MHTGSLVNSKALEALRRHLQLPVLQVILKSEWSSLQPDHRLQIRKGLIEEIEQHAPMSAEDKGRLLDLEQTPRLSHIGISISHNKTCGGFALNPQGQAIGFDVEISARVKENLISRVAASSDEVKRAPSAASLWVAKEAALKCLLRSGLQPNVVAEVEIGDWQTNSDLESCRLITKEPRVNNNRGCVMNLDDMKLAVFTVSTN